MPLIWRQIRVLTHKNLRITLYRRWLSAPLRAFFLPMVFVLLLSYAKNFFIPSAVWGMGKPQIIRPFLDVLAVATGGRDRVVFVNNGHSGGEIDKVISDVTAPLKDSGLQVLVVRTEGALRQECRSSTRGSSRCISAAVFHSSPFEGEGGFWNYTIRADGALGTKLDVGMNTNDAQIYTLPLQHAIDFSIGRVDTTSSVDPSSKQILEYPFTSRTFEQREDDRQVKYMDNVASILAVAFYISMVGVLYQLTGLMATEREIGMATLLDTMMPNRSRWQPPLARLVAHHLSFSLLYAPGWIAMGAIFGGVACQKTSIGIPLLSNLLCGLSLTSLAIFVGCCFRKAQLSGITSVILTLILAIIAQVTGNSVTGVVTVLSILFPPMNYVYLVIAIAKWEGQNQSVSLSKPPPNSTSTLPVVAFWIFAIIHAVLFPLLGALIEKALFGSASYSGRITGAPESSVAVQIKGFSKTYPPRFWQRLGAMLRRRRSDPFTAVKNLDLQAYRGEVMVLLGANGSGKSTTLDAIAGMHSPSAGHISTIYAGSNPGFGYCPQKNVLWDDLTVSEHAKIFDGIKSQGKRSSAAELKRMIESCDLTKKRSAQAKVLSGGQQRKLQLVLMLVGGSTICCVDEVSSGVDPLSRRKLWDILLTERGRRTLLLTTHFLDEADLLADRIAILSHGSLKAYGTSVELKQNLGMGYRVHLQKGLGAATPPLYRDILHVEQGENTVYFPGTSGETYGFLRRLDGDGVNQYQVNGPTLEDVFLRVVDESDEGSGSPVTESLTRQASVQSAAPLFTSAQNNQPIIPRLLSGKSTGMFTQGKMLLYKRFIILRRNPAPYLVALLIPIVAAGCATLFLRNLVAGSCNPNIETLKSTAASSTSPQDFRIVVGPKDQLTDAAIKQISAAPSGAVTYADTLAQFNDEVHKQSSTLTPGGFFLGDQLTFAWRADGPLVFGHTIQNIMNNILVNTTINSDYQSLEIPFMADVGSLLIFVTYFGLAMTVYPAFLGLYPTIERLKGIRSMHYSNGVHALPLWLAYLTFDFMLTLAIATISTVIFVAVTKVWYHLEYIFLIFLLYGIAMTLFSYIVSMLVRSQLAAFAITAGAHAGVYLVFFVVYMVTLTYTDPSNQNSVLNISFYTLGVVSPAGSLARSLYLALNIFGLTCRDRELASYPGAIDVFGGPILYLVVQSLLYFAILLWMESGRGVFHLMKRKKKTSLGNKDMIELETGPTSLGTSSSKGGLEVMNLTKRYKKFTAVDNISFTVPKNQCFALLGPNGAGKTTSISMIRGDVSPSSRDADILVENISVLTHRVKARARLGVCPQIDPLDSMTVTEHLRFYAEIRGIPSPQYNIDALVTSLGLHDYTNRLATKLSGGNKRKLSLAIALMGNPGVLLLDEPSSGMDAASKRRMWRTLAAVTPGRSLVLTTHSMEEADALAGQAGILAGRMLAAGSTEELRRRFGSGHSIHLVHRDAPRTSDRDMQALERWIQGRFPMARWSEHGIHYGQVRFEIPASGLALADVFEAIEIAKARMGIEYYSVSRATLDQVFLNVVGGNTREED